MKSVVVEASTVAKAIETAWLKAEKPEEFFIRVLQQHHTGFFGFGSKKAKIVLFFKNTRKSDSLFPVVLKQKEYTNFFGNFNLKAPAELNVVDHELNKNIVLGGQKKKPHHQQNNQQVSHAKNTQPAQHKNASNGHVDKIAVKNTQQVQHANKVTQPVHKNVQQVQKSFGDAGKQEHPVKHNKVQNTQKQQTHQPQQVVKNKHLGSEVEKALEHQQPKLQVSLQAPQASQKAPIVKDFVEQKTLSSIVDGKDDVVKNIAKVLKKVQTQKIVANVSRPSQTLNDAIPAEKQTLDGIQRVSDKVKMVTPKFESYAEYAQANLDKAAAKHAQAAEKAAAPVVQRPVLQLKRRPLTTENPGVSGITRSVKPVVSATPIVLAVEVTVDSSKDKKE